jgi:phosphoribosylformylglycinamidine synthase
VTREVASICAGKASDITAVHDVGGGGIAGALAEMVAVTGLGASLEELEAHGELFSEFPGRFLVATKDPADFHLRAAATGVPVAVLGVVGGDRLTIGTLIDVSVDDISIQRAGALVGALESN